MKQGLALFSDPTWSTPENNTNDCRLSQILVAWKRNLDSWLQDRMSHRDPESEKYET
jgi:hypothetical protein